MRPWKDLRISVRLNRHRVSDAHVGQVFLIDIHQHPHAAGVGNHEALSRAGLKQLPRGYILLHHESTNGRLHRNLKRRRALHQRVGIRDAQHLQSGLRRCQVAVGLHFSRLCLFQVLLGNRFVFVQVFGAGVGLLRQRVGFLGLQVVGAELRIVWTGHIQHGFALMHVLARNHHDPADRPAHLGDDRRGAKTVVSDCPRKPQRPGQSCRLNFQDLHMRHLLGRNGKQFGIT